MEITIPEIVRIGGFDFRRILFSDLKEFFPKQRFNILFNCVENRLGVYYFFDTSEEVSYVGYTRKQSIKVRINQYRTLGDSGNSFWQAYEKQNPGSSFNDDFRPYVEGLRLGTISTDETTLTDEHKTKLMVVSKGMEDALICKYEPTYNNHYYRVTDGEYCRLCSLASLNVLPNISSPENSPG